MNTTARLQVLAPPSDRQVSAVHALLGAAALTKGAHAKSDAVAHAALAALNAALRGELAPESDVRCVAAALTVVGVSHSVEVSL